MPEIKVFWHTFQNGKNVSSTTVLRDFKKGNPGGWILLVVSGGALSSLSVK